MIVYSTKTNWFDKPTVFVNPVNCVGVMGTGVAREIKRYFPSLYEEYRLDCQQGLMRPGDVFVYRVGDHLILNAATKGHYRYDSKLSTIKQIVEHLNTYTQGWDIPELSMPKLGCGRGGLNWNDVEPLINKIEQTKVVILMGHYEGGLITDGLARKELVLVNRTNKR